MKSISSFIKYLLVFGIGYSTALYMHSDVIEETPVEGLIQQLNLLSDNTVAMNYMNLEAFLAATQSDFNVQLSTERNGKSANVEVTSAQAGTLWVYAAGKQTDSIIPLCGNEQQIDQQQTLNLRCDVSQLVNDNQEITVFTLVTRTKSDEQKIRRFIQLRANLLPGQEYKGLAFSEDNDSGLGIASQKLSN